jgi:hypothetical protein
LGNLRARKFGSTASSHGLVVRYYIILRASSVLKIIVADLLLLYLSRCSGLARDTSFCFLLFPLYTYMHRAHLSYLEHNVSGTLPASCSSSQVGVSTISTATRTGSWMHDKLIRDTELVYPRPPVFWHGRFFDERKCLLPPPQQGDQLYRRYGMPGGKQRLECVLRPGQTLVERNPPGIHPSNRDLGTSSPKSDMELRRSKRG